jgi:hypothetical protein
MARISALEGRCFFVESRVSNRPDMPILNARPTTDARSK